MRRVSRLMVLLASVALAAESGAQDTITARNVETVASCGPVRGTLALVLPGGGAKGFAHLGVLRMLDSLGIVPDLIVGTSAGAIIGALYASGLDVAEIERDVKALGLDSLVGRYSAPTPLSLGTRRAILSWEYGNQGFVLRTGVVREGPLNALVSALFTRGNLIAAGSFDRLPIPFRAVAADLRTREQVVIASGDLAQAVRASSAIPIIFRAVRVGGRPLVDGGIVDNVPIDAARKLGATRLIVSGLRDTSTFDVESDDPLSTAGRLLNFMFEQPIPPLRAGDVWVTSDVSGVNQLDFSDANIGRVIAAGERGAAAFARAARGAEVTDTALRAASCLPRGRVRPRGVVPPIASAVVPEGLDADVDRVVWLTLGDFGGRVPSVPRLQERVRSLSRVDRFRAIWLHPARGPSDSVVFNAEGQRASNEELLAGAAYDRELGPRIWIGRVERLSRRNAELSGVVSLGQLQQEFALSMRRSYDVLSSPWSPLVSGTFTRAQVRDIRDGREFPVIQTADWLVEAGVERRLNRRASVALTAFGRQWDEPVFAGTPTALGARLRLQSSETAHAAPRGAVTFEGTLRYWRAAADVRRSRTQRGFTFETLLSAVLGERLPLQSSAFLGGADVGFPGYKIQELRGAQAAMAALRVAHRVYGPVNLQGTVAGGALQRRTYGVFRDAHGYFGGRGGLGVTTALGPIAFEYGVNDRGRSTLYLRFGDWF